MPDVQRRRGLARGRRDGRREHQQPEGQCLFHGPHPLDHAPRPCHRTVKLSRYADSRRAAVVRRAVLLLLALLAAPAAQAQDTGTYTLRAAGLGRQPGHAWVDFNADGKADYCRVAARRGSPAPSRPGTGFGATYTLRPHDAGLPRRPHVGRRQRRRQGRLLPAGRRRRHRRTTSAARSRPAPGSPRPATPSRTGAPTDAPGGRHRRRHRRLLPVTGSDPLLRRLLAPTPWAAVRSAALARGRAGRAWVDFTGDGKADFCRVTACLACTRLERHRVRRHVLAHRPRLRARPRVGRRQRRPARPTTAAASATAAPTPASVHALDRHRLRRQGLISAPLEWGDDTGFAWVDFEGDGDRDFCRPVAASPTNQQLFCTLWTPAGLAHTIVSGPPTSATTPAARGSTTTRTARSTTAAVVGGGAGGRSASRARPRSGRPSGRCPPGAARPAARSCPAPAPAPKKTRLVVTLSYDYSVKGRWTRITRLAVKGVAAGATVKATCKKGCSRKSYSLMRRRAGRLAQAPDHQAAEGRDEHQGGRHPDREPTGRQDPEDPLRQASDVR